MLSLKLFLTMPAFINHILVNLQLAKTRLASMFTDREKSAEKSDLSRGGLPWGKRCVIIVLISFFSDTHVDA